jgi:hypothetical protein
METWLKGAVGKVTQTNRKRHHYLQLNSRNLMQHGVRLEMETVLVKENQVHYSDFQLKGQQTGRRGIFGCSITAQYQE